MRETESAPLIPPFHSRRPLLVTLLAPGDAETVDYPVEAETMEEAICTAKATCIQESVDLWGEVIDPARIVTVGVWVPV